LVFRVKYFANTWSLFQLVWCPVAEVSKGVVPSRSLSRVSTRKNYATRCLKLVKVIKFSKPEKNFPKAQVDGGYPLDDQQGDRFPKPRLEETLLSSLHRAA
jgi:hypothetical protein